MGDTAENVASHCGIPREAQDASTARSQVFADAAAARGFWKGDITAATLPDGSVVRSDDGPRRGVTLDKVRAMQPVFRPHRDDHRQLLPAQRRRGGATTLVHGHAGT